MKVSVLPILLGLAGLSTARTDISGCISSQTTNQWHEASLIWYVPGSGEICDFVDCGGGRAPPKTDQPGCPLYSGTATLTASYLPGYGPNIIVASATTASEESSSIDTSLASSTSSASSDSSASSATDTSAGTTSTGDSMITPAPTSSPIGSTKMPASSFGNSTATAATTTATGNMAGIFGPSPGLMMVLVAAIGAISL
ncbi:hypothetical protein N7495_003517 [Penicillium taxi]|uniref:uncharacterized protein n=1 Tax=Penicillium taxi TaxID=168475 RepID=UPI002545602F|nr:uncharacterized protein N7495_003517 [Penicillium taxi]KAJ5898773.1 hypothetical protein N7495_003517 [Penicillium taxi]